MDLLTLQSTFGGLLHDTGKAVYRAGGQRSSHSAQGYQFLCEMLTGADWKPILDCVRYHHASELESVQIPEYLENYVDYEAYGRDVALDKDCQFNETTMSGIPRNPSWRFTTETQRIPQRGTGSWLFPNKKLRSGWILTRKLSGKKLKTRANSISMKCWPLRKSGAGIRRQGGSL